MTKPYDRTRSGDNRDTNEMRTRKFSVSAKKDSGPSTLNEEARTVEITIASETDQVMAYDWELGRSVPEILVMSGCVLPDSGQVPLLDSHGRYSVDDVLGSVRGVQVDGDMMSGTAHYSEDDKADRAFKKTKENHLTDYSAGFRVLREMRLDENQTTEINGRAYEGPCILITEWALKEVSTCPIGADPVAKARADHKQPAKRSAEPQKKESSMKKTLRDYLIRRGLDPNATEDEAWVFLERLDKEPGGARSDDGERIDPDKVRAEERERISGIRTLCRAHGCEDLADGMVSDGNTIDEARAAVLNHIETKKTKDDKNKPGFRAEVIIDGRDKFRAAAQDALSMRAGLIVSTPAPGHDELFGRSLTEMARLSLRAAGQSDRGVPMEMVGRALTTSDFPIILGNIANMALNTAFESADESWSEFCAEGSVSDFKIHTLARASEADDLDEIGEDGEYKYGSLSESKETYAIATFGKLMLITRQAIINDDMGVLTDIPAKFGESCSRKLGDAAFSVVTANAAMGDGVALFHSTHGNLAGSVGAVGEATFGAGVLAMKTQKDIRGKRRLNIRPQYYLAPCAVEQASESFFVSEYYDTTEKAATRRNIYSGSQYKRIYEPRLDDFSTTAWFLLGPKGKTIKIFFLNGNKKPYMESRQGWTVDGVEFKVRIDAAAKAIDWKAMYKNAGE